MRLRNWDAFSRLAKEPCDSSELLRKSVEDANFFDDKNLYLKTQNKDGYFDDYGLRPLLVKVHYHDATPQRIAGPLTVTLPPDSSIALLKRKLSRCREVDLPLQKQRLYIVRDSNGKMMAWEVLLDFLRVPQVYVESLRENVLYSIYQEVSNLRHECNDSCNPCDFVPENSVST